MEFSIAQHHASCVGLFHTLAVSLRLQAEAQEDKTMTAEDRAFEDTFDKFNLWAGNSGAMHVDLQHNESSDHKLREVSFYGTQALKLLQDLKAVLEATLALTKDEQSTLEEDGITRSNNLTTDPSGFLEGHDPEEEDSPWEVSSESEDDGSPVPERRTTTSTGAYRTIHSTHSTSVSRQLPLLESAGYIVSCLWKLPLRRLTLPDLTPQPFEEQSFDVMHVWDKYPAIDAGVAKRLGRLVSRRRRSIRIRKIHEDAVQGSRAEGIETRPGTSWRAWSKLRSTTRDSRVPITDSRQVEDQDSPYLSESTSSVASERTTQVTRLKIPQRPRGGDGRYLTTFICPCCSTIQSIVSERKWRKHVLGDLQPYVCTYPECPLCEYAFRDRGEWFAHEQSHRPEWHCNDESHESHDEQSKFFKHLDVVHEVQVNETHRPILARSFQRPSRSLSGRCNLCGEHSEKLKSHLSRHLEELFLFAIPQIDRSITSATKNPQITLALPSGPSNSSVGQEQPTSSATNRGDASDPTVNFSSQVARRQPILPKVEQTYMFSGSEYKHEKVEYRWCCCGCGYGGNSVSLDRGCASCADHWRCNRCRVEKMVLK